MGSQIREGLENEDKELALCSAKEVTRSLGECKVIIEVVSNAWFGGCGEGADGEREGSPGSSGPHIRITRGALLIFWARIPLRRV